MQTGVRGRCVLPDSGEVPPEPEVRVDRETASELGARLLARWRRVQQEQAEFTRELRLFDLAHAAEAEGALTSSAWLRSRLKMTGAQAAQQLMVARQLDSLPQTAADYAAGDISYQHAAVIASCARKLGTVVVAEREQILSDCARQVDPYRLGLVTQQLEHCVDPDGSLSFFEKQHQRRCLMLHRQEDGMYTLRGVFDPEGGALIATGLEALMSPPAADDWRSTLQRRADALVEKFRTNAESPQLTVICEPGTLRRQPGCPGGELRDSQVLPGEVVRRLGCDCGLQEGHVCADGINVHLGELQRLVSPRLRRQLELRDRHCRFPGCDRPAPTTDAHHLQHWADGGKTKLPNLVLLCRRHHRKTHEGGWSLSWSEGGQLLAEPP